jgi:hypothetical protein
MENP